MSRKLRQPATKAELENRIVRALMALSWTKVGPYRMPKEPVETWCIKAMEMPECAVFCSTQAECLREWPRVLDAYLRSFVAYGELPPHLPIPDYATGTANSGGYITGPSWSSGEDGE